MTIAEEKQAQRAAGRAARKALDAPQRAAANAALCRRVLELDAYRTAHTLLLYAAFGGEANLAAVAAEAARQGKTVAYPVCGEGFSLTAAVPGADGWAVGQYGIHAPVLERSTLLQPEQLDLVLVMSVEPGFGGQSFMEDMMPKVTAVKNEIERRGLKDIDIEVDGGINKDTISVAAKAGANAFVSGSALFGSDDIKKTIADFKRSATI